MVDLPHGLPIEELTDMDHSISTEDRDFKQAFEALKVAAEEFDHRAHVRGSSIPIYKPFRLNKKGLRVAAEAPSLRI